VTEVKVNISGSSGIAASDFDRVDEFEASTFEADRESTRSHEQIDVCEALRGPRCIAT
jgi:hypothetical protein